jgi:hypothetical protein
VSHLELCRGPLSFELDRGLLHDPMLWRLHGQVEESVEEFKPDIIHVVSLGDVSEIGVYVAKTMKLPGWMGPEAAEHCGLQRGEHPEHGAGLLQDGRRAVCAE